MKQCLLLLSVLLLTILAFPQSDQIVPNENLTVEDIPAIPASLAASVDATATIAERVYPVGIPSAAKC